MAVKKAKTKYKCAGRVMIPVRPGMRAIVEIEGEPVMTSKVVRVKKQNARKIVFETENSVYEIIFPTGAVDSAA